MAKPVIGITCSFNINPTIGLNKCINYKESNYMYKISKSGGIPFLIPVRPALCEDIEIILSKLDGIVFSGGVDVHPIFYNQEPLSGLGKVDLERDEFEILMIKKCVTKDIPFFGICRGLQIINCAFGGTLYQDIDCQIDEGYLIQHSQNFKDKYGNHTIKIKEDSFLYEIYGKNGFVNSYHHQAIKDLAYDLEAVAWSFDGLVEAVNLRSNSKCFAVQWHPERMEDTYSQRIFDYFINKL